MVESTLGDPSITLQKLYAKWHAGACKYCGSLKTHIIEEFGRVYRVCHACRLGTWEMK